MQNLIRNAKWAGLSVLVVAGAAQASFVPLFQGTSPSGSNTAFNYTLSFGAGTSAGGPVERLQSGDFLTIYDIPGFVSATAPAGFSLSVQNTGITPGGTVPADDSQLPNVTFTYTGDTLTTDTSFVNALIISSFGDQTTGTFTSRDTSNQPPAGQPVAQIGPVTIPGGGVPEPGSILGLGALGMLLSMRRRK
jgi:hypothetical protein